MNESLTWTHFGYLLAIIAGWSMIIIGTCRWVITAGIKGVTAQFAELGKKLEAQGEKQQNFGEKQQDFERKLLEMKADIPVCYVRREDFIRHEVTILTKLDRLRDLISENKDQGKKT